MSASTPFHHLGPVDAAAAAVATAAIARRHPVLVFRAKDLVQVGAYDAKNPVLVPARCIAVAPPTHYTDDDHLGDLCAHRIRKGLLHAGHTTGSLGDIDPTDAVTAVSALVAAAKRRGEPDGYVAMRFAVFDDTDTGPAEDDALPAGWLRILTGDLPADWQEAREVARDRITQAIEAAYPGVLGALAAPPDARLAA